MRLEIPRKKKRTTVALIAFLKRRATIAAFMILIIHKLIIPDIFLIDLKAFKRITTVIAVRQYLHRYYVDISLILAILKKI